MDATQQITTAKKFLETQYYAKLLETLRKGEHHLVLDFQEFSKFHPGIADELLEEPEEILGAFEMALESFDFPAEQIKRFHFRVTNLPDSQKMLIRNVRSVHLGRFLQIDGVVRQKSDVRPQVTSARFECPSCGNIISVLQLDTKFKEPSRCGCGRKGKFKLIAKELVDAQGLVLEEAPEDLEGGEQPKRINVFLKDDLVSPLSEKRTNPGNKIRLNGIIKEVPIELRSGAKSTRYEILLEGNFLQPIEEDFTDITISEKEEQEIKDLAQDQRLLQKLVGSIAPSIYGHEKIKEALLLQLAGGVRKIRDDGVVTRGDIHVLLIGDPGAGKCVAGDTKIVLDSGEIVPIKKLVEQESLGQYTYYGQKVYSINLFGTLTSSQPLRFWKRKAPSQMLKIVTGTGNELIVTNEHPLFTTSDGIIFAKEAHTYHVGEYIALPNKIVVEGSLQKIPKEIRYSPAHNRVKHRVKEYIDGDVARFLGYLIGDGYVSMRKTTGLVSFTNADQEILRDFEQLCQRVLGITPTRRRKQQTAAYESYLSSIEVVRILEKIDENITKRSAEMRISDALTRSPNAIVKEFLRSLFECEAFIDPRKREIEFSSKSKDLIFDLKLVLLRFGIISQVTSSLKYATNTSQKIKRRYYRLRISGENVCVFAREVGFVSTVKTRRLQKVIATKSILNTNINIVPHVKELLKLLRKQYGLHQSSFGMSRSSYQHYERGDRHPSRQKLQQIAEVYTRITPHDPFVQILTKASQADLFWDKIREITIVPTTEDYVYDLEIEHVHNFVANGVMVHNSQLLKRITKVAPKSRYVSGRGATAAGLCVAPTSMVMTNPGGMTAIEDVVEPRIRTASEYRPGIWKQDNITDVKIQSMSHDLTMQTKHPESLWKLEAPVSVFEIRLRSGKKIELTANTQLFTLLHGRTTWIKSKELQKGMVIATPRRLIGGNDVPYTIDLISSNPIIYEVKDFITSILPLLTRKYGDLRTAAKALGVNENQLYHHWVNKKARGNIHRKDLQKICEDVAVSWKKQVKVLSLYRGKKPVFPPRLTKELLYCAGLVAGDGDLREQKSHAYAIRLSNATPTLQKIFQKFLRSLHLKFGVQKGNENRPEATRTASKLLGEIFIRLGIPLSPKSHKIYLSDVLLHLPNDYLASYIAGLYDTDGSVYQRKGKAGSNVIEYYTCSEKLARQLQIVLLRYSIQSTLRYREPQEGIITRKLRLWVLSVRGSEHIKRFSQHIPLRHPAKQKKLALLAEQKKKEHSNIDLIPGAGNILKSVLQRHALSLRKTGWHNNLSRAGLQQILSRIALKDPDITYLDRLANSDIFWDEITSITAKKPTYKYVYDLTINDSHNFVVDGVLVHNTASVVKDEFLRGWALEAGALVLANKGICMLDEMDKMTPEDRSAMHEALEQQCYHYDTEIMFVDGSTEKIGDFVSRFIENHKHKMVEGKDCEILRGVDLPEIMTTDFTGIFPVKIHALSRHKASSYFCQITYSNGRSIMVTPEHPVYIVEDGRIVTREARTIVPGMMAPAPRRLSLLNKKADQEAYSQKRGLFLGLFCSEGHSYQSQQHRYAEIGISNTNRGIVQLTKELMETLFAKKPFMQTRFVEEQSKATKELVTVRLSSQGIYQTLKQEVPELLKKAPFKRVPHEVKTGSLLLQQSFLQGYFLGDGFVDKERTGFVTSSYKLAEDVQQLLLNSSMYSYIETEKRGNARYHKIIISGLESYERFYELVPEMDSRKKRIQELLLRSKRKKNDRDVLPYTYVQEIHDLLKHFKLDDGYFFQKNLKKQNAHRETCWRYLKKIENHLQKGMDVYPSSDLRHIRRVWGISMASIAKAMQISLASVYSYEETSHPKHNDLKRIIYELIEKKAKTIIPKIVSLHQLIHSDLRFLRVVSVKRIKNIDQPWTYDVTIEPTHSFISQNLVLHNSVSVSKANIQATLRAETTVLAAANPKFGRFDPYETLSRQIDLPPTLINRFDLIFPIRDIPDAEKDSKMAKFILLLHQSPLSEIPEINTHLLRKYIAYARQRVTPVLSDSAIEAIEEYYLKMRGSGSKDGEVQAIPISARQLEALVRLTEASAKLRLSTKALKKDALKAIELLHFCLSQVGVDPETGKIDIDRISTGVPATERSKIVLVREIIHELENTLGKTIPIEDIVKEAVERGIEEEKVEEAIEQLKRKGDIFEPRKGFLSRI
ncbi:helix-turn-helix domain-containing protein [Candidatus Woesearchaeota archaeon]|nr:helix-turn-helix domain-containing protein [Candidatus Woesearchaeota archaeon]